MTTRDPLQPFSAPVRRWFADRVGVPTEIQALAWPVIGAGEHVLVTAPTGSGKTLTAFLWAIDRFYTGVWQTGGTRVLYVSPLKALGNDIRRNLLAPLEALPAIATGLGLTPPAVRVASRTGDTPEAERRRMGREPPEILITTPESLNILLTSRAGRRLLEDVRSVILDEVHAVLGSKRGVHLITAVERLSERCGEIQRIALSATVHPDDVVARWIGGARCELVAGQPEYRLRAVRVVRARTPKLFELEVALPVEAPDLKREADDFWTSFAARLKPAIRRNRSTLLFGNSRRTVEKVARFLNEGESKQLAWSHHGALSREIRQVVEERLKAGLLPAIVATSSLELGIDVGAIDEVIMVQTPPTVAAAVQRLGRSGHGVGETSRGRIVPLHPLGLLEAAVVCRAVVEGAIETVRPTGAALDVLAQVLLSMAVERVRPVDELYHAVRAAQPYHQLSRRQFDLVLDLLAGRYASTRLRHLRPLVTVDGVDSTVRARPGAERLLYLSGGTIPDRGYYQLKVHASGAPLGQLDEEFVWERAVGDSFTLGVQSWKIERITHNDVMVTPIAGRAAMAPFWRAEARDRSAFLSTRIGAFLARAEELLERDDALLDELCSDHHLQPAAAAELVRLLREQRAATGALPHRHQVIVEHTAPPAGPGRDLQLVIHTMWGGTVNRPLAYALATALERRLGMRPEIVHGDDSIAVTWPAVEPIEDPFALVPPAELEELLRARLEHTGFFGARFREAAGRALVLPRAGPRRRTPLWVHRQRAKELLEGVSSAQDFPLVLEAWRTCLQDDLEVDVLLERLAEVREGRIRVVHTATDKPSPFAASVLWQQTNRLMYEDDVPESQRGSRLRSDLVREVALSSELRPTVARSSVRELEQRLQRTAPGYAPGTADELLDWLRERGPLPVTEWRELAAAITRDHGVAAEDLLRERPDRVVSVTPGATALLCLVDLIPRLTTALGGTPPEAAAPGGDLVAALTAAARIAPFEGDADEALASLVEEWLRFVGPLAPAELGSLLGIAPDRLDGALEELADTGTVVVGRLTDDATVDQVCDRENLERLLRLARAGRRPSIATRSAAELPLFLAVQHGLGLADAAPADLERVLERLAGWPAPAAEWETELLPARLTPYLPSWLDALLAETDLTWLGCGEQRLSFGLPDDLALLGIDPPADALVAELAEVFPHEVGRFTLAELAHHAHRDSTTLTRLLWRAAWSGAATSGSFAVVRQALAAGFEPAVEPAPRAGSRRVGRGRFQRWHSSRPFAGSWFRLAAPEPPADALAADELERDRARLLLERHGILFRALLERELPALRWGRVFRALRLLELAGEAVAGHFFDGAAGLQFASHDALRRLGEELPTDRIWWLAATDPASPASLGLESLGELPRRLASNHLVFHGRDLVAVSERRGARLELRVAPGHPHVADYLGFLRSMIGRAERPLAAVEIETINGEPATASPYRPVLETLFHVTRTPAALRLSRRY